MIYSSSVDSAPYSTYCNQGRPNSHIYEFSFESIWFTKTSMIDLTRSKAKCFFGVESALQCLFVLYCDDRLCSTFGSTLRFSTAWHNIFSYCNYCTSILYCTLPKVMTSLQTRWRTQARFYFCAQGTAQATEMVDQKQWN